MKRLRSEFERFLKQVCSDKIKDYQRRDLEIAFMCGAFGVVQIINGTSGGNIITMSDMHRVFDIGEELREFFKGREMLIHNDSNSAS